MAPFPLGPLQYIAQLRLKRQRKRDAIRLLMKSGVLRSANHPIRYGMTPKELRKLLAEEQA